jgi:hypothetical protein
MASWDWKGLKIMGQRRAVFGDTFSSRVPAAAARILQMALFIVLTLVVYRGWWGKDLHILNLITR